MRREVTNALLPLLLAAGCPAVAAPDLPPPEIYGFLDLQWEPGADGENDRIFRLGQAEVDLDAAIADRTGVCVALAWDPVTEAFGVGTAAVNLQFSPGDLEAFCRPQEVNATGVIAGRFDVPFGIDWLLYPSINRPLVSMPLPVEATHGGWNADGVLLYGAAGSWNALLHATSGFDHSRVLGTGGEAVWTGRQAVGGRLGAVPRPGLAVGVSAAGLDAVEDGRSMVLAGADVFLTRGPATLRGEFLRLRTRAPEPALDQGWYAAAQWDFGPCYGIVRWDEWYAQGASRERRISLGTGVPVRGAAVLRGEYAWWPDAGRPDALVLQLAAGFD